MKDAWDYFVESIPRRQFFRLLEKAPEENPEDFVSHETKKEAA
jgi:hypothetical protein